MARISFLDQALFQRVFKCNADQIAEFPNEFKPQYIRPPVISDPKWWLVLLSTPHPPRSLASPQSSLDPFIWVDASSEYGMSLLYENLWFSWRLIPGWRGDHRDIGWLEALAIELVIQLVINHSFVDSSVLLCSDNQGAIAAFEKCRSRNFMTNLCIHRSALLSHETQFRVAYSQSFLSVSQTLPLYILLSPFILMSVPHPTENRLQGISIRDAVNTLHSSVDAASHSSISNSLALSGSAKPCLHSSSRIEPSQWRPHVLASG